MDKIFNPYSGLCIGQGWNGDYALQAELRSLNKIWSPWAAGCNLFYTYVFSIGRSYYIPVWAGYDTNEKLDVFGAATPGSARELFRQDFANLKTVDDKCFLPTWEKFRFAKPEMIAIICNRLYEQLKPAGGVVVDPIGIFDRERYPGMYLCPLGGDHRPFIKEDVLVQVNDLIKAHGRISKWLYSIKRRRYKGKQR